MDSSTPDTNTNLKLQASLKWSVTFFKIMCQTLCLGKRRLRTDRGWGEQETTARRDHGKRDRRTAERQQRSEWGIDSYGRGDGIPPALCSVCLSRVFSCSHGKRPGIEGGGIRSRKREKNHKKRKTNFLLIFSSSAVANISCFHTFLFYPTRGKHL